MPGTADLDGVHTFYVSSWLQRHFSFPFAALCSLPAAKHSSADPTFGPIGMLSTIFVSFILRTK